MGLGYSLAHVTRTVVKAIVTDVTYYHSPATAGDRLHSFPHLRLPLSSKIRASNRTRVENVVRLDLGAAGNVLNAHSDALKTGPIKRMIQQI